MTEGGALTVVEDVEAEVPGLGGTQVGVPEKPGWK